MTGDVTPTQKQNSSAIIHRRLVGRLEYDIEVNDNGNISQFNGASKLIINFQDAENTLELKKNKKF